MQKTLRINLLTRNQAVKRSHKKALQREKREWDTWRTGTFVVAKAHNKYIRQERRTRQQDWFDGPLAPNRNSGNYRGVYGAVDATAIQTPTVPRSARLGPDTKMLGNSWDAVDLAALEREGKLFKGRTLVGNVVIGDRVCVVRGPDGLRGRIGTVAHVIEDQERLVIRNLNVADVAVPGPNRILAEHLGEGIQNYSTEECSIPINHCRLVVGPNEIPTLTKDVIVRHLEADAPYIVREYASNQPSHTRYISGLHDPTDPLNPENTRTEIPWPEPVIGEQGRFQEGDTDSDKVSQRTYNVLSIEEPVLGYAQQGQRTKLEKRIQEGIMNELADKYAAARSRHTDDEWLKRKILADARSIWWRDRKILTPGQEKAEHEIAQRQKALAGKTIDEETRKLIAEMQKATLRAHQQSPSPV